MPQKPSNRGWGAVRKHGITRERYEAELAAGNAWCCDCKTFLPSLQFSHFKDKHSANCKTCATRRSREWYIANRHRANHRAKLYYKKNAQRLRDYQRKHRESLPPGELQRRYFQKRLKERFGLTPQQYDDLLASQGGGCAICGNARGATRLPVDHDHSCCPGRLTCGKCIRGIICNKCNVIVGFLEKNAETVRLCERYITKHRSK